MPACINALKRGSETGIPLVPRLSAKLLRSGQIPASPSRHNEISAVTLQLLLIPQHLLHHLHLHLPTEEHAGQLGLHAD